MKRPEKISQINLRKNKSQLVLKLDKLCRYLDDYYDINAGGCCFVAYCLAKLLHRDGFKYQLIICSDDIPFIKYKNLRDFRTSQVHYYIKLGHKCINYDSFYDQFNKVCIKNCSSRSLLYHYKHRSWNWMYDSLNNNYEVEKMITKEYYGITECLRKRRSTCNSK